MAPIPPAPRRSGCPGKAVAPLEIATGSYAGAGDRSGQLGGDAASFFSMIPAA
jgi:hypothetical protein